MALVLVNNQSRGNVKPKSYVEDIARYVPVCIGQMREIHFPGEDMEESGICLEIAGIWEGIASGYEAAGRSK